MKLGITLLFLVFLGFNSQAQYDSISADTPEFQTIIKDINAHGVYGGLQFAVSKFDNRKAILLGGQAAWIVNHALAVGGVGYSFFNQPEPNTNLQTDVQYKINGGYGGVLIKYIVAPKAPVHISAPLVVGAGGVAYTKSYIDNWDNNGKEPLTLDEATFFVIEPGIEFEMNMLKFVRMSVGMNYRFTSDIILETELSLKRGNIRTSLVKPDILNGWSYSISFQIGIF